MTKIVKNSKTNGDKVDKANRTNGKEKCATTRVGKVNNSAKSSQIKKEDRPSLNEDVIDNIKNIIKTKIRPILVMDGGNIEFVEYKDNVVSVKLLGACNGCPLATLTLKNTVKSMIKEAIPEVEDVEAIDFAEEELE